MNATLLAILTMFSGPIGQLISAGITAGGAALTTWMLSKGVAADSASTITGGLMTALGGIIHIFTGTQSVKINSVNTASNGAKVVSSSSPGQPLDPLADR